MADWYVSRKQSFLQRSHNPDENSDHNCLKCTKLISQLEETRKELSSSQLIIKLLYKEIKEITKERTPRPTTTSINNNAEYEDGVDIATPSTWSRVVSKQPQNKGKPRISEYYPKTRPIISTNRYSSLANLSEPTICRDEYIMPDITKATQTSTNKYMKTEKHERTKHPSVTRHPRNTTRQPPTSHHEVQSEVKVMCDQNSNGIPTIVNGQINPTKESNTNNNNSANNNRDHIHDLVSESTMKVLKSKAKYSKCFKHKVLVVGDSHRGCAAKITASLDTRFDVCGVVKPGSNTEWLMETVKDEVGKLTMNDFLILCSGTNDMNRNFSNAFNNITNFIRSANHTNIILISVPHRYDVTNSSDVNNKIKVLNRKLLKLAKMFSNVKVIEPANNRLLFTRHGLHLNESGKELLSNQSILHIFSVLEKVNVNPITLGWYDKNLQVNVSIIDKSPLPQQVPKRIKKLPVTRNGDFLWGI